MELGAFQAQLSSLPQHDIDRLFPQAGKQSEKQRAGFILHDNEQRLRCTQATRADAY